jgi:hypothetical protein
VGTGACRALTAGVIIDCTWAKSSIEARTTYADAVGQPIELAPTTSQGVVGAMEGLDSTW